MTILPPQVIGSLSPCSSKIRLQGQFPEAQIEVIARRLDGADVTVVTGTYASAADQTFDLDPGVTLQPRWVIRAFQTYDGETSPDQDQGIEVMNEPHFPTEIHPLTWISHPYACGRCIRLGGAIPGGVAIVTDDSGTVLGRGMAIDTLVRLTLNRPIRLGERLHVRHEACGIMGRTRSGREESESAEATQPPDELPPPQILDPLIVCGNRVYLGDVYEGASVTLTRSGLRDRHLCNTKPGRDPYFELGAETLEAGEAITIRQAFPECQPSVDEGEALRDVEPANTLPTPKVEGPVCEGSQHVIVDQLVPEAEVRLINNGREYRASAPAASFAYPIPEPGLEEGMLTVVQKLCEMETETEVEVISCVPPERPVITPPYACATRVHVSNVQRHARLRIHSNRRGWIGDTVACEEEVLVPVPALIPYESLRASTTIGGVGMESLSVPVRLLTGADPLVIQGIILNTDRIITVAHVIPGAVIEIFVNGEFRCSAISGRVRSENGSTVVMEVPIVGELNEQDAVTVRQHFCGREFGISSAVNVRRCRGRIQVGLRCLDEMLLGHLRYQTQWMGRLFRHHEFDVIIVDERTVEFEPTSIECGSTEWNHLRQHRENLGANDIGVYMVEAILPPGSAGGCHIPGARDVLVERPRAIGDEPWTMAHEVGHVLGLSHVGGAERLMYPGRRGWDAPNPTNDFDTALTEDEKRIMETSPYTYPC